MARTLADCLDELRAGQEISAAEWARLRDAFEARRAQHRLALGDDEAAARAAADIADDIQKSALEKSRRAALTAPGVEGAAARLPPQGRHARHQRSGNPRAASGGIPRPQL
jgi:hypothetical protein